MRSSARGAGPTLALLAATVIWGSTFVLVKDAIRTLPPLEFLALRFGVGAVLLAVLWRPRLGRTLWVPGVVVGLALAGGYGFQTLGLAYTSATKAAFITGLFVVFTPVGVGIFERRTPSRRVLSCVALATIGLALLTLREADLSTFGFGDGLVLVCAVAFAGHIVALGHWAPVTDVKALSVAQLTVAAVVFAVLMPLGGVRPVSGTAVWTALAVTAVGATAFGFAVQTWAQSRLSPTRTAVILTMEPVFGGVFGYLLAGDRLTPLAWVGAVLILIAMLAVELRRPAPSAFGPRSRRGIA